MASIEMEIAVDDKDRADEICARLLNGEKFVGVKHGKWVVFVTCDASEILHIGQELHYELLDG